MKNYYVTGSASKGYRIMPEHCNYKNCKDFFVEAAAKYCEKHRKVRKRELADVWRLNNVDRCRELSRNSWRKVGVITRRKRFKENPELADNQKLYLKKWREEHKHKCKLCEKLVSWNAEYCKHCNLIAYPRGFVLKR